MGAARRGAGQERTAGDSGSRWPRQWICESSGDQTPIIFRALTHPRTPPALTAVTTSWSASGRAHQPILSQLSSPLFFADRIASRSRPKHESTPVDTTPPGQSSDGTPWLATSEVLTLTVIVNASQILHLSTGIFGAAVGCYVGTTTRSCQKLGQTHDVHVTKRSFWQLRVVTTSSEPG